MTIERVIVAGFKSFAERTEVALRPLTILAGANGAGKSTLMHALLLLKQTLESDYDAGPLRLDGPHVAFSRVEQMLWAGLPQKATTFTLGLHVSGQIGYEATFAKGTDGAVPLAITEAKYIYRDQLSTLSPVPSQEQLSVYVKLLSNLLRDANASKIFNLDIGSVLSLLAGLDIQIPTTSDVQDLSLSGSVQRERCFLFVPWVTARVSKSESEHIVFLNGPPAQEHIRRCIQSIIHLPGLRGNPRRTYPAAAVGSSFRGPFTHYAASVIAEWQRRQDGRLSRLNDDLFELGLTSYVCAQPVSDVELALRVGRTPGAESDDLVDIADTGLGLSQALPVLVALLVAEPGQLVLVEHPELHLHPRAVRALAGPLQRAIERGVWVVLETHSDLLLISLQEQVARGALRPEDVLLHWVQRDERGASVLHSTTLDESGAWGDMPIDFNDVHLEAMRNYLDAAIKT
jgi:hypothetical protein